MGHQTGRMTVLTAVMPYMTSRGLWLNRAVNDNGWTLRLVKSWSHPGSDARGRELKLEVWLVTSSDATS